MAPQFIMYDEAKGRIGIFPSLSPRPSLTNIRALTIYLVNKLVGIPSQQSEEQGYSGMAQQEEVYALTGKTPWVNWPDPGNHQGAPLAQ